GPGLLAQHIEAAAPVGAAGQAGALHDGAVVGQQLQGVLQGQQVGGGQIGEQGAAGLPQAAGQGSGQGFQVLPEKSVPDGGPGGGGRVGGQTVRQLLQKGVGRSAVPVPYAGLVKAGALLRRQNPRKTHPQAAIGVADRKS